MEWNVKNAVNRDVERQHLNKILADIRATVGSSGGLGEQDVRRIVQGMLPTVSSVTPSTTVVLEGDVTGRGTGRGTITVQATVEGAITDAPIDATPYWRNSGNWESVPDALLALSNMEVGGLLVYDLENLVYTTAEITGVAGQIEVLNGDGSQGNPEIGLAEVTDAGGGQLRKFDKDDYGRVTGTSGATTDDLDEGTSNLYYTDARADARISLQKGQPDGLATLDSSGHVPTAQLPGTLGTWSSVNPSSKWDTSAAASAGLVDTAAARLVDLDGVFGQTAQIYSALGTAVGAPVLAAGVGLHVPFNTAAAGQLYWTAGTGSRLWFRGGSGSTWGTWREVLFSTSAGNTGQFYRGDMTWSNALTGPISLVSLDDAVNASGITVDGYTSGQGTIGVASNGRLQIKNSQTADTLIDIDPTPTDGVSTAQFRFFRNVNTTASVRFSVYAGDGTALENHRLSGKVTNSSLCSTSGNLGIGTASPTLAKLQVNGDYAPNTDNTYSSGIPSRRHSVVYAGTGTINTSDAREKTAVTPLTQSELEAAVELGKMIGTYQWLAMVAVKGQDARRHVGMTVQAAIGVMESFGLDPFAYGFICHDEWEESQEVRDEEGELIQEYSPAGDRYSFRMDELMMFIAAGVNQRLSDIENRLTAAGL